MCEFEKKKRAIYLQEKFYIENKIILKIRILLKQKYKKMFCPYNLLNGFWMILFKVLGVIIEN